MCHVDSPADGRSHVTTIRRGDFENYFQQCQNSGCRTHSEDMLSLKLLTLACLFHRSKLSNFLQAETKVLLTSRGTAVQLGA